MKQLVVFDLDGTLNQTNLYAVDAVRYALRDLGVTGISDAVICSHFGSRPEDYVKSYFPDGNKETLAEFLRLEAKYEDELMAERARAFDGAQESLRRLKEDGFMTAICSNASRRYIELVLKTLELATYIDEIQPLLPEMTKNQTLKLLLERVRPEQSVMIGDRIFDQDAADANQIPFIGCAYGYNPEEIAGADIIVSHAGDLYQAVREIFRSRT